MLKYIKKKTTSVKAFYIFLSRERKKKVKVFCLYKIRDAVRVSARARKGDDDVGCWLRYREKYSYVTVCLWPRKKSGKSGKTLDSWSE